MIQGPRQYRTLINAMLLKYPNRCDFPSNIILRKCATAIGSILLAAHRVPIEMNET